MAACTGAPWRDVPEKYGKWNLIYRRFRRWSACGVWESVAIILAETMAESGHYDIDSTSDAIRDDGGIRAVIPPKSNRTKMIC
jgi:hypothetical protein